MIGVAGFLSCLALEMSTILAAEDSGLTWVYMEDAEPFNWEADGVAKGLEVEIVQLICDNLGITVMHKFYPWQRAQEYIKAGEADGMMSTPTPVRFEYAVFGKEYALVDYTNY